MVRFSDLLGGADQPPDEPPEKSAYRSAEKSEEDEPARAPVQHVPGADRADGASEPPAATWVAHPDEPWESTEVEVAVEVEADRADEVEVEAVDSLGTRDVTVPAIADDLLPRGRRRR